MNQSHKTRGASLISLIIGAVLIAFLAVAALKQSGFSTDSEDQLLTPQVLAPAAVNIDQFKDMQSDQASELADLYGNSKK
jgi:hypothetical protein